MPKAPEHPLTIVSLVAENIKRLKAVRIEPTSALIDINGRNRQGKTSVLDSIWMALKGWDKNANPKPIREGQQSAKIKADLGEIVIIRNFKKTKAGEVTSSLDVLDASGNSFNKPQTLLDSMVDALSIDPLEFERANEREQFDIVKKLVPGVDFDAIAACDKEDRRLREETGRDLRRYVAAADAIEIPADAPTEKVDEDTLGDELERALEHNNQINIRVERRAAAAAKAAELRQKIIELAAEAAEIEKKLAEAGDLPKEIDVEVLRARQSEIRAANAWVDKRAEQKSLRRKADGLQELYDAYTADIAKREESKREAIRHARLPVEGLEIGDGVVLLNGLPFQQASDAERLRASLALAMARNPQVRVIRVRDGGRLDSAARELVEVLAAEHGFQIWMERVAEGEPVGVRIEDGEVQE